MSFQQDPWDPIPRAAQLVRDGMAAGTHIGAQVYVSVKGTPVADLAFGEARRGIAMRTDTLMPWFSCTKPLGAVALAKLWEHGDFDLDYPVARFIPEFAAAGKHAVTLRHILTHTGGFETVRFDPLSMPWDAIIERICSVPLHSGWVPGRKAGYKAQSSWYILAEVIQRISGRQFCAFVRREIFEPLGMRDSWVGISREHFEAYGERAGTLYKTAPGSVPAPLHEDERILVCNPGGSGYGPVRELARLYESLLFRGKRGGVRILQPVTVEALTSRHRVAMYDETFRHTMDWGLGFILDSNHYGRNTVPYGYGHHSSPRTFGHGGWQSSAAFADPEHGLAVAVVFNGTPGEGRHNRRIRAFCTALYEDLGFAAPGSEA
jgi:CubicO group peptidase (beta-lactamase class C family)